MKNKVIEFSLEHQLFSKGDKIIVALSGGADSVSLFNFFLSIKDEYDLTIYAAHLNHKLRGDDAENDMHFVEKICNDNGVILYKKELDILKIANESNLSTELCGRNERYKFFMELSDELNAKVATAHSASDNTETVLFNISRGASLKGAAGIPVKREYIIRPLLCVTRDEIEKYCKENNLTFVTDKTNFEDVYNRNKIRLSVVPILKEINEDLDNSISRFSKMALDSYSYIQKVAREKLLQCKNGFGYDSKKLLELEDVVLRMAIMIAIQDSNARAESKHIDLIINSFSENTSVVLLGGYIASCKQGIFRIIKEDKKENFECMLSSYDSIQFLEASEFVKNDIKNLIDYDKISDVTVVRNRKSKDTFRLPKRGISKPLRKLLNEFKVPEELRDNILVVANENIILWCEHIGTSEDGRISANTKRAIKILEEK